MYHGVNSSLVSSVHLFSWLFFVLSLLHFPAFLSSSVLSSGTSSLFPSTPQFLSSFSLNRHSSRLHSSLSFHLSHTSLIQQARDHFLHSVTHSFPSFLPHFFLDLLFLFISSSLPKRGSTLPHSRLSFINLLHTPSSHHNHNHNHDHHFLSITHYFSNSSPRNELSVYEIITLNHPRSCSFFLCFPRVATLLVPRLVLFLTFLPFPLSHLPFFSILGCLQDVPNTGGSWKQPRFSRTVRTTNLCTNNIKTHTTTRFFIFSHHALHSRR